MSAQVNLSIPAQPTHTKGMIVKASFRNAKTENDPLLNFPPKEHTSPVHY